MQTNLGLRQQQNLALTPALRQSLRLLQLPLHELEQALADALQDNPLLLGADEPAADEASDAPASDSSAEYDSVFDQAGNEAFTASPTEGEGRGSLPETAASASFSDVLLEQLRDSRLGDREALLVACLIAELDDNGYLLTSLEALQEAAWLAPAPTMDEWQAALARLQSFDPPGVGARSLSECLLLQLRDDGVIAGASLPPGVLAATRQLAEQGLALLAKGRWGQLRTLLRCDDVTLSAARALLCRLEPRPARPWGETAGAVVPELLVRRVEGIWQVRLNDAVLPRIRLYEAYGAIAASAAGSTELRAHWQQAKGLVSGLQQRYQTLLRVAQAVVAHQQAYFDLGDVALRPLRQADIAQALSLHESTVSRAVAHKYLQGPGGVVPLSHCFGATLAPADDEDAGGVASQAVRHRVAALIAGEDPRQPLSDNQLATLLSAEGVQVARRTVAKYRELAGLPPASRRGALTS